jgi:hypothetical protein
MTRYYTTAHQAEADARAIDTPRYRSAIEPALLEHIHALVCNPATNSDMLLITADALRIAASATRFHRAQTATTAATQLALTLSDLAPTRANPIEDEA